MEQTLECPNCHRIAHGETPADRCPRCGFRLIASTREMEAEVRRHLYGRSSLRTYGAVVKAGGARTTD
ncbi:MAG TPA: hypothetical protein VF176_01355 [Solirubrobacterales bacterium]